MPTGKRITSSGSLEEKPTGTDAVPARLKAVTIGIDDHSTTSQVERAGKVNAFLLT